MGGALACYAEGEKLARAMGTVDVLANILVSQATTQIGLGDIDGADGSCQGARLYYKEMQDPLGIAECEKVQGVICRERQQYEEAEERLKRSLQSFETLENQLGVAECELELGLLQQRLDDVEGARHYWQSAATHFAEAGAATEANRVKSLILSA